MSIYHAVRVGRKPGIFTNWPECKINVKGYLGAEFASFGTLQEAEAFMQTPGPKRKISNVDDAFVLTFDGQCKDGISGSAFAIKKMSGEIIECKSCRLNNQRENEAKYLGLVDGLNAAMLLGIKKLLVKSDSEDVINQINGNYKPRNPKLVASHQTVIGLLANFEEIEFLQVSRREIAEATIVRSLTAEEWIALNKIRDRDRD